MVLTSSERAALGVLSLWPALNVVALQYFTWYAAVAASEGSLVVLVPVQLFVLVVWMGLLGFYLYHAATNGRLNATERWVWALALPMLSPVTMPLYWAWHLVAKPAPVLARR